MINHVLGELMHTETERIEREVDDNSEQEQYSNDKDRNSNNNINKTRNLNQNKKKRMNSTPVWPTELPDVFSFPDTFFELQKDLDYSVLEYLIRMGYARAAKSFHEELEFNKGEGEGEGEEKENEKDNDGEVFNPDNDEEDNVDINFYDDDDYDSKDFNEDNIDIANDLMKQQQCSRGLDSVEDRKEVMRLILNGQIEESILLIDNLWPSFFNNFKMVKLRLLHLQSIEMIREFFNTDISKLKTDEIELMEEQFFDKFILFVRENLSDETIVENEQFLKDMEHTMGLLTYGKFKKGKNSNDKDNNEDEDEDEDENEDEDFPTPLKELLDLSLRDHNAERVNNALLVYVDGVDEEQNDSSRLEQMVKLFVWSYSCGNRGKVEKMAAISVSQ